MTWQPAPRFEVALTMPINTALTAQEASLDTYVPVALWTPAAWTAAAITFLVSRDGSNFADLYDELGVEVTIPSLSIPTGAIRRFALNPRLFLGVQTLRIRSGTGAAPVNQAAARSLILVTRPMA